MDWLILHSGLNIQPIAAASINSGLLEIDLISINELNVFNSINFNHSIQAKN